MGTHPTEHLTLATNCRRQAAFWLRTRQSLIYGLSLIILGLGLSAGLSKAAQNPSQLPGPLALRTNRPGVGPMVGPRTNPVPSRPGPVPAPGAKIVPGAKTVPGRTNLVAAGKNVVGAGNTNAAPVGIKAKTVDFFRHLPSNRYFYPGLAFIGLVVGALFSLKVFKKPAPAAGTEELARPTVKLPRSATRKTAVHSCNVLRAGADARQLWQFDARGGGFALNREHTAFLGDAFPANLAAKDWTSLWQRKLNVAWLPPESVFLRVVHLPRSDFDETVSMVELQLEKFSPMPLAQVVWSMQVLPHVEPNMQTIVVTIASRSAVEEFLGKLEGEGYLADRLEVPMIDQLQAVQINEDTAWIYPGASGGANTAVVAWWSKGVLQNLDLLTLPEEQRAEQLKEQLFQMAWAGEMEGWLAASPRWHLVAEPAVVAEWEPLLRTALEQPVQISAPLQGAQLAALTARRAAQAEPRVNLLPPEFAVRYQQQFVDRLWMRGLGALGLLYLVGLVIYAVALSVATYRTSGVEHQVAALGPAYTNAVQLKAKYDVLREREELKYAALNCYKTVAEKLPDNATLEALNLSDGKRLMLSGTAPSDMVGKLLDFESEMRKAKDPTGEFIFDPKKVENLNWHQATPPTSVTWNLTLDLKRAEAD